MQRVPTELITDVLGYLSHTDLRKAASVAHRFYRAAQDAGCRVFRTVDLARPATLATFRALVEHAVAKTASDRPGIGLRLSVNCTVSKRDALEADFGSALQAIEASLPLLVHLEAYVPTFFAETLHCTLSASPAQRLRTLSLGQASHLGALAIALPRDLFANTAPRLRTLCLVLPSLDAEWQQVTVFRHVLTAQLGIYQTGQPIAISRSLPHLRSLTVRIWYNGEEQTPPELNLSGLNLRHLAIHGYTISRCTLSGIDLTKVQVFECGAGTVLTDRVWTTLASSDAPMTARFAGVKDWNSTFRLAAVTLESAGFTRTALSDAMLESPIDAVPNIGTRLTAVHLCGEYLSQFLRTEEPLLALAEIYVDLTSLSGLSSLSLRTSRIRCPALKSVTLFSREGSHALHSYRVAMLGEILKQDERPESSRAVLTLVRLCFLLPVARRQLNRVFPVIYTDDGLDIEALDRRVSRVETPFIVPFGFVGY